jgi:hypothetical protein
MSADDRSQWPFPSQRKADQRAFELSVGRVLEQRDELAAMLNRTALGLKAIALLNADVGPKARAAAADLAEEAIALLQRVEGR